MTRPALLDASFLIALEQETAQRQVGPARELLQKLRGRPIVVSVVTIGEILEGAVDESATVASLRRFAIHGLHLSHARRCALIQRRASRRLGENDAWLVATAQALDADIVAKDRRAFERLGAAYLRF